MKKGETVFIVEALRWGDRENHSYVVGVFRNESNAKLAAKAEEAWRGGKYECQITKFGFDELPDKHEKLEHLKMVS